MKLFRSRGTTDEYGRRRISDIPEAGRNVFSYHANRTRDDAPLERGAQNKPNYQSKWLYIPSFIAAAALIISIGYIFSLSTTPKVNIVMDSSEVGLHDIGTYQQAANSALSSSWLNHSKFTIDTGNVSRQLKQQFPELNDV